MQKPDEGPEKLVVGQAASVNNRDEDKQNPFNQDRIESDNEDLTTSISSLDLSKGSAEDPKYSRKRFTSDCLSSTVRDEAKAVADMEASYKGILVSIGENPDREGLLDTPRRAAKAMMTFTQVNFLLCPDLFIDGG